MEDNQIVDLYWARNESAITETASKYGKYCYCLLYTSTPGNEVYRIRGLNKFQDFIGNRHGIISFRNSSDQIGYRIHPAFRTPRGNWDRFGANCELRFFEGTL